MAKKKKDPLEETTVLEETASASEDITENEPIPTGDDAVPALETAEEAASAGAETPAGINVPKTPKKSRKKNR